MDKHWNETRKKELVMTQKAVNPKGPSTWRGYLGQLRVTDFWGGEPEIEAMSGFLQRKIHIIMMGATGRVTYGNDTTKLPLYLIHTLMSDEGSSANHYHYGINHAIYEARIKQAPLDDQKTKLTELIAVYDEELDEGELVFAEEWHAAAWQCLEQVKTFNPIVAWEAKGNVLFEAKKYPEALDCYQKVVQINSKLAISLFNRLKDKLLEVDLLGEALNCFYKAASDKVIVMDHVIFPLWEEAVRFMRRKNYSLAMLYFKVLVNYEVSTNAYQLNKIGIICFEQGDYATAALYFEKAGRKNPNKIGYSLNRAEALIKLKQYELAIYCYQVAFKLEPTNVNYINAEGMLWNQLGNYQQAVKCFQRATEMQPQEALFWHQWGNALIKLKDYQLAGDCYAIASRLYPENAEYLSQLGMMRHQLGEYKQATKCFQKATELQPEEASFWYCQGNALAELKSYQSAVTCYTIASKLDPANANYLNEQGNMYARLDNHKQAAKSFQAAIDINPKKTVYHANCGDALIKLNEHKQAALCYERTSLLAATKADQEKWRCVAERWRQPVTETKGIDKSTPVSTQLLAASPVKSHSLPRSQSLTTLGDSVRKQGMFRKSRRMSESNHSSKPPVTIDVEKPIASVSV